jgi:HSP20 family protein
MSLVKFSNSRPSVFDRVFDNDIFDWSHKNYSTTNTTLPSVNIKEDNEGFEVEVAVPGFDKSDFNIEIDNEILTISSEKTIEDKVEDDKKVTRREFSYQSFKRTFTLPVIVESDKITAKYENGILVVNIPKKEEAKPKPSKKIEIK